MKIKRHAMTLLEIMIVIFIIAIIGGVLNRNMRGNLDKGKMFQSEHGSKTLYDVLALEIAQGANLEDVIDDPRAYLVSSGMVQNPDKILKDGWGHPYRCIQTTDDNFIVYSETFLNKLREKKTDAEIAEEYPWLYSLDIDESSYSN